MALRTVCTEQARFWAMTLVGCPRAGEQNLAPAHGEGVRGAQIGFEPLALLGRERTNKERGLHSPRMT